MSDAQEPTMEEILASIRRIISEDDAPASAQPAAAASVAMASGPEPLAEVPAPKPAPSPAPAPVQSAPPPSPPKAPEPEPEDDVLELTEPLEPAPMEEPAPAPAPAAVRPRPQLEDSLGDLDVFSSRPATPAPAPAYTPAPPAPEEPLVGSYAAESTAGHFGALARTVAMPKEGRTLEDVVRELLRPMLREWLDSHLPGIVETRVQAEVERISRRNQY